MGNKKAYVESFDIAHAAYSAPIITDVFKRYFRDGDGQFVHYVWERMSHPRGGVFPSLFFEKIPIWYGPGPYDVDLLHRKALDARLPASETRRHRQAS